MAANRSVPKARILVHVHPGARRAGVVGPHGDGWKLRVTAPPTDGRANAAVSEVLAEALGVGPSAVTVVGGWRARRKWVEIIGMDIDQVTRRLGDR